jgi:hypothetical protein
LAEIACGDFSGHQLRCRRRKAWLSLAAPYQLYGAILADIDFVPAGERGVRTHRGLRPFRRLRLVIPHHQ